MIAKCACLGSIRIELRQNVFQNAELCNRLVTISEITFQVRFVEDDDGYIRLDAYAPKSTADKLYSKVCSKRHGKNR